MDEKIVCDLCNREFAYKRKRRTTRTTCGSCIANRGRFALKAACVAYKGGACQLCGYSKCLQSLTFHHINPEQKSFTIGSYVGRSASRIQAELDKCILLCRNCHGEIEEAITWRPQDPILKAMAYIVEHSLPGTFEFSRRGWREYHPATKPTI